MTVKILTLDPSGNASKREGFGTTGWAMFEDGEIKDFGAVKADNYLTQERYWHEVWNLIDHKHPDKVVCESYRLFHHKAQQQSGSSMDTPALIGYLRMMCYYRQMPIEFQAPSDKTRVNDEQLVKLGIFEMKGKHYYCNGIPVVVHTRDALRHGVFWHKYGAGKELVKK
jgi:hypothetical protein